jgi:FtsZ-binding cell division protein ZapB
VQQRDWYLSDIEEQKLLTQSLQDELGVEAEMRVGQYEERLHQLDSDMQKKMISKSSYSRRPRRSAMIREKRPTMHRGCDNNVQRAEAQRCAITMFDRLQSEVHRANNAVDKISDEAIRLRSKNNDLRNERSSLKRQRESENAEGRTALEERDSTIANLRSLLKRCNQELDGLETRTDPTSITFQ